MKYEEAIWKLMLAHGGAVNFDVAKTRKGEAYSYEITDQYSGTVRCDPDLTRTVYASMDTYGIVLAECSDPAEHTAYEFLGTDSEGAEFRYLAGVIVAGDGMTATWAVTVPEIVGFGGLTRVLMHDMSWEDALATLGARLEETLDADLMRKQPYKFAQGCKLPQS